MSWSDDWTVTLGRYAQTEPIPGDVHGKRRPIPIVLPVPGLGGAHWVVAGSSGAGKTWMILLALAKMARKFGSEIAFVVIDPKMVDYRPLVPRISTIAYGAPRALGALELAERLMNQRYRLMREKGIYEWSPEVAKILGPYLVLVIDEVANITLAPKPIQPTRKEMVEDGAEPIPSAETRLIILAQMIRQCGGGLIIATQSPKVQVLSNLILEQCPIRWCGRTRGPEQTKAVLESHEYPCHIPKHPQGIPLWMKGGCYVDNGEQVRRGRTDGIDRDLLALVGQETADDRFDFGWPHEIHPIAMASAKEG